MLQGPQTCSRSAPEKYKKIVFSLGQDFRNTVRTSYACLHRPWVLRQTEARGVSHVSYVKEDSEFTVFWETASRAVSVFCALPGSTVDTVYTSVYGLRLRRKCRRPMSSQSKTSSQFTPNASVRGSAIPARRPKNS